LANTGVIAKNSRVPSAPIIVRPLSSPPQIRSSYMLHQKNDKLTIAS
jgi:hypothetical protein